MKTPMMLLLVVVCIVMVIFTGGLGLIPIVAIWIVGYFGQLHHGTAKSTMDGKPNPRSQGRAPDDDSHWYAEDGCGKWDLNAFGPEVVAERRAHREKWEAAKAAHAAAEEAKGEQAGPPKEKCPNCGTFNYAGATRCVNCWNIPAK